MRYAARIVFGCITAVGVAIVACGGSSSNPPANNGPGTDSGTTVDSNVADTNLPDTNVPDTNPADTGPACVDADLTTLNVPDAAIGDSGYSTGTCLACAQTSCGPDLTACNNDCTCRDALVCVYQHCAADFGNTTQLATCAIGNGCVTSFTQLQGPLGTFAQCIGGSCGRECGIPPTPDAGPDSGPTDAGDGGG
jgi:hypothetical protein